MKRTLRSAPPAYRPANYKPPDQPSTVQEPADDDEVWLTRMPVGAMLGVAESKLWHSPADTCDLEEEEYLKALAAVQHDAKALRIEVMFCMRLNLINRFMTAHDFLRDNHGIDYAALEFQTESLDNLLLCAVFYKAYKVLHYLVVCTGRDLLMVPCNTPIFHGGTTLHVAIIRGCLRLVRMTLEGLNEKNRLKVLNTFGNGTFFSASGSCYSVPLLLALQTGQMDIFFKLVDYGADPTVKDPHNGNGMMHAITLYGRQEPDKAVNMMHGILKHETMKRWYCKRINIDYGKFTQIEAMRMRQLLLQTENVAGYSPLTHAALYGVYPILQALLQMDTVYKRSIWNMGASSLSYYDMTEVDPTVRDLIGRCKPTVLELLLYERDDDNIPALTMEPLHDLMRSRWQSWKLVYICWGLWHLMSISAYTMYSIFEQATEVDQASSENVTDQCNDSQLGFTFSHPVARMVTHVNMWIIVLVYLLFTITGAIQSVRLYVRGRVLWPGSGHYLVPWSVIRKYDDFNMHLAIFCILTLISLLRVIPRDDIHNVVTGFGIMEGWYFLLFFTRAFRHTSLFTVITNRMFHLDLLRFSIIAIIHIISFGSCLMILLSPHLPDEVNNIFETPQTMFLVMIGVADLSFLDSPTTSWVAKVVGIGFVISATVLLLNLLIAAMGDTYAGISENKECIWLKMRVRSVLILDRLLYFGFLRRRMMGRDLYYKLEARKWTLKVDNTDNHLHVIEESLCESILRSFTAWLLNIWSNCNGYCFSWEQPDI